MFANDVMKYSGTLFGDEAKRAAATKTVEQVWEGNAAMGDIDPHARAAATMASFQDSLDMS